jgi:thiol:disulfide interchange protein
MTRAWYRLLAVGIVLGILASSPAPAQPPPAPLGPSTGSLFGTDPNEGQSVATLQAQFTAPADGKPGYLFVTATIEPGWHVYSLTQPPGGPLAAKIEVGPPPGVGIAGKFQPTVPPEKKKDLDFDMMVETHQGTVTWYAPIQVAAGLDPANLIIRGRLTGQACSNACIPLALPFAARLGPGIELPGATTSSRAAAPRIEMQSLLAKLALAFLGGMILNIMPCVLPVISLKILAFLEQSGESRGRVFALNVWYALGLLSVFMVLAALAASAGLSWGEQFTRPWFKVAMTALVFVMALSFLGVWEIPIPGFVGAGRANQLQTKEGPSGAFFKGVFATILATPCSGPFLGPVFGYLLDKPPYMAYWIFGAVGLGMAAPYLVIGAFPRLIRLLPRPGAWMETMQQFMGFLLLGTVVYLLTTLSAALVTSTQSLLVGLWFAVWWIGRTPLTAPARWRVAAWIGGPMVAALVGVFAFTVLLQESKIPWQPFSPEALQRARAEGKTVMVDFTAKWCPNCRTNSKFAIETDAVAALVKANGVVPLLADWTDESPMIKKALNELGYNSIPLLAIWPAQPSQREVITMSDVLMESQVLEALKEAGPSKSK